MYNGIPLFCQEVIMKFHVAERLKTIIDSLGMKHKDFAKLSGIPYPTLQDYLIGKSIPGGENLQKIIMKFHVNLNWLLTGEGEMFVDEKKAEIQRKNIDDVQNTTVKINYYPNVTVSAGYGIQNEDESFSIFEVPRQFLIAIGIKFFKNLDLISVVGDSMEPFISNGEMIIVERTQEARNGDIVIANINGEVYVKKLQKDPFKRYVKLISTNPAYLDIELKDEELDCLKIIGVVRAKIRPF